MVRAWIAWAVVIAAGCGDAAPAGPAPRFEWTVDQHAIATRLRGEMGWGQLDVRLRPPGVVAVDGSGLPRATQVRIGETTLTAGGDRRVTGEVPLGGDLGAIGLDLFDGSDRPVELPVEIVVRGVRTAPFRAGLRATRSDVADVVTARLVAVFDGKPVVYAQEPAAPRAMAWARTDPTYGWIVGVVGDVKPGERLADLAWVARIDTEIVGRRRCGRYRAEDGSETRDVELEIEAARARVYDRKTGALIDEKAFAPAKPRCAAVVALQAGQRAYTRGSGDAELAAWLEGFAAKQVR